MPNEIGYLFINNFMTKFDIKMNRLTKFTFAFDCRLIQETNHLKFFLEKGKSQNGLKAKKSENAKKTSLSILSEGGRAIAPIVPTKINTNTKLGNPMQTI